MHAFGTLLVQFDESKTFMVLLIIKLLFLNFDILHLDFRKPFYKECLIYYMHGFDDQ